MNPIRPYHRYVFDQEQRIFVGEFEEMYRAETDEGFDSWSQDDLRSIDKQIAMMLIDHYNFDRILDIGCGKGTFTHLLKKTNNYVLGIDISTTAIEKARAKYADVDFQTKDIRASGLPEGAFDLVVAMEVFSYLDCWRTILGQISESTSYLFLSLYLPPGDPIGFVKTFDELKDEIQSHFTIETELLKDSDHLYILAASKLQR